MLNAVNFVKMEATGNDFIVVLDKLAELDFSPELIKKLCDRHFGIGADGFIRIIPTAKLKESLNAAKEPGQSSCTSSEWFMDYYNSDGSLAEMCGNGARAFAQRLLDEKLVSTSHFVIGTRAGNKSIEVNSYIPNRSAEISVNLGIVSYEGISKFKLQGKEYQGDRINVGNPHLVTSIADTSSLAELDLAANFAFSEKDFPAGTNLEFYVVDKVNNCLKMRVRERGVGETLSCGTGIVATAYAYLKNFAPDTSAVEVKVLGGTLEVKFLSDDSVLKGNSQVVYTGEINLHG